MIRVYVENFSEVPLTVKLGYHGTDALAPDQGILKIVFLFDCILSIYKLNPVVHVDKQGFFELRCRVEEVSKNHQVFYCLVLLF